MNHESRIIIVCQDQTFEEFMDMIVNEFGEQLWPSISNPFGGFIIVDSDDAFEMLVRGPVAE